MLNKVKSGAILKFTAILLVVSAVSWFAVERKSTGSQKVVAGRATTITSSPSQWEQSESSFSISDKGKGNVTLTAEYLLRKSNDKTIVLNIYLNTHSVDLSTIDLSRDIYLVKDGKKLYPLSTTPAGEIHHRSSELTFVKIDFPFHVVGENIGGIEQREVLLDPNKR